MLDFDFENRVAYSDRYYYQLRDLLDLTFNDQQRESLYYGMTVSNAFRNLYQQFINQNDSVLTSNEVNTLFCNYLAPINYESVIAITDEYANPATINIFKPFMRATIEKIRQTYPRYKTLIDKYAASETNLLEKIKSKSKLTNDLTDITTLVNDTRVVTDGTVKNTGTVSAQNNKSNTGTIVVDDDTTNTGTVSDSRTDTDTGSISVSNNNSATTTNKFNDTPQNGGDYSADTYTTTTNQQSTSGTDSGTTTNNLTKTTQGTTTNNLAGTRDTTTTNNLSESGSTSTTNNLQTDDDTTVTTDQDSENTLERTGTATTENEDDGGTLMARLVEIREGWRNIYADWAREFSSLFIL